MICFYNVLNQAKFHWIFSILWHHILQSSYLLNLFSHMVHYIVRSGNRWVIRCLVSLLFWVVLVGCGVWRVSSGSWDSSNLIFPPGFTMWSRISLFAVKSSAVKSRCDGGSFSSGIFGNSSGFSCKYKHKRTINNKFIITFCTLIDRQHFHQSNHHPKTGRIKTIFFF